MTDPTRRRFALESCLGRGAYGEVYRATMHSPGGLATAVAVKVLRAGFAPDSDAVRRLRDEGRALARIDHPSVLRVHDLVLLEGRVALVTELVDGADLRALSRARRPLEPRAIVQIVGDIAGALHAAWSTPGPDGRPLELVHRDVKPSNIRIGKHGEAKLLDFGIARSDVLDREARTGTGVAVGSHPYMAPERFVEKRAVHASDVFGLGCCAFEALTGGRRFYGRAILRDLSALALDRNRYAAHLATELGRLPRRVPDPVRELVASTLAHEATARPDAGTLAAACEQLADELDGLTLRAWCRQHDWLDDAGSQGELDGRVLTEGTLPIGEPAAPVLDAGTPVIHRSPVVTVDPGAAPFEPGRRISPTTLEHGRPVAELHTPAPPARPSGTPRQAMALPPHRRRSRWMAALLVLGASVAAIGALAAVFVVVVLLAGAVAGGAMFTWSTTPVEAPP